MGFAANLVQGLRVCAWRAVPSLLQIALCFPSFALWPKPFIYDIETYRNWTSNYRDQKSTIKRCKWKGVDVSQAVKICFPQKIFLWQDQRNLPSKRSKSLANFDKRWTARRSSRLTQRTAGCAAPSMQWLPRRFTGNLADACQCFLMLVNDCQCLSMFVNACQCLSMLLVNVVNADQLELFDNSGTFRKSQFSDSVANLQKENVRDSFEAPQELPEGWASIFFHLVFNQFKIFFVS